MINSILLSYAAWQWWIAANVVSSCIVILGILYLVFRFFDDDDRWMNHRVMNYVFRTGSVIVCVGYFGNAVDGSVYLLNNVQPPCVAATEVIANVGLALVLIWLRWLHRRISSAIGSRLFRDEPVP